LNANGDDGWISLLGKAPCYPSIVDGCQIQLLNSSARGQITYASAPYDLKIQFSKPQPNAVSSGTSPGHLEKSTGRLIPA
jgi:hypothetical protein